MPYADPEVKKQKDAERRRIPGYRERQLTHSRRWKERNREKVREYRRKHRVLQHAFTKKWREHNPTAWHQSQKKAYKTRRTFPGKRIEDALRARVYKALRGKKVVSTRLLLGAEIFQVKEHLEKQFRPGMSWENYGPVWHVDHIRPCVTFDLSDPEQQRDCFHFSNLQPLFAKDSLVKGAKYARPQ